MAPTFRHGMGAAVLVNNTNMGPILNDAGFEATANVAEVTNFGSSGDRRYIAGDRDASGSYSGMFDGSTEETDAIFEAALGASAAVVLSYGPEGYSTGRTAFLAAGRVTSYTVSAPASDKVSAAMAVQYTSEFRDGYWLAPLAARSTATTHGTVTMMSQVGSSKTTNGAIGHLHVTAGTTNAGGAELTMKIQDSSNASVWADLMTFTAISSTNPIGNQRLLTTGIVYDSVKATAVSQFSTNITYAVAFALR